MIATLRSEAIKSRTVRINWVLTSIAVGLPIVVATLFASLASRDSLDGENLHEAVHAASFLTVMLMGVFGATTYTGEHAFGTIRPTFAATPRRLRVISAKAVVVAVAAMTVMAVTNVAGLGLGSAIASRRDAPLGLGDLDGLVPAVIGGVLFCGLAALLGLGFGMLVRSSQGAVALILLWPLLIEGIAAGVLSVAGADDAAEWLPWAAGSTMSSLDPADGEPSRVAGALVLAGFVALVVAAGAALTDRRDA
jgi:ABC-2 type transport system permease protein